MDIGGWLRRLGLEQYEAAFRENKIDDTVLPRLTAEDLKELGVGFVGDRRKLLDAIAALREEPSAPTPLSDDNLTTNKAAKDTAERRQVTVMFVDLVGSTALSTRMDPEDLREVISAYQRCVAKTVRLFGGFLARYMGDGVLAYFGYPQAHEHDVERAMRVGLSLVEAVPKLKTSAGVPLQVRVGIATGLVVVGDLVGAAAQEQGVVGETPNLAARLQALAEPGTVVISSRTRRLTGGLFDYRDLGMVPLKGFAETVPAWQVLGASATDSRFEALRASTTPLIGRREEIDLLLRRWEQAKGGQGSVVLLSGESGIGKSRIAETIVERLSDEPHTRLRYFCSPHHQDSAFYPSIAQLERAAGFRRDDTDEQRLAKLEAVLILTANDLGEAVPLLAGLLSVPTGDRYPGLNLTPQKRKEKTLRALVAQVEELAARQPVLMVVEDAHWADPTSLELFELIVDRASSLSLLAIVTFRPEFVPPWVGRPEVTLISLNRLPRRLRVEMIALVTGGKVLPQEIVDQITDRTDGIPLFIEELTKAVVESGLLVEAGDRYVTTGPVTPLVIPTSLQESLLARFDRLAPTSGVAQFAAALGRQFSHELINAVAAMPLQQLDGALAQLVNAELIFRRGTPPDAEYIFKHALVQEAAYSTLLRSRRQQIHARIAATLEDQFQDIVAAQPGLLARHCSEAGLAEKAVVYWLKAGQQALARSAMTEAVARLQQGLEVLAGLPDGHWRRQQELDLQIALRTAVAATKGLAAPAVGEILARARALAEQVDRPEHIVPLFSGQWAFHRVRSEHGLALQLGEQLEGIGEARRDAAAQWVGRILIGQTRLFLGELIAARTLLEQCNDLSDLAHHAGVSLRAEEPHQYVSMLAHLALTLAYLGYLDQARLRRNEALSQARRARSAPTLANALSFACLLESIIRSPDMGGHAEELSSLSTEHGFPFFGGVATTFRGASLTELGKAEEGLALITQGLTAVRASGAVISTSHALVEAAEADAKLGQPAEGVKRLVEAARIIETTEQWVDAAEVHRLRGDLLDAVGDSLTAERCYHQALAVASSQSAKLMELRASIGLARLWSKQDRRGEARDLLAPIYDWFTEGLDTSVLDEAKSLLEALAQ
jgi:class 3 adenylate cyclase/tetratricopeptide (TPR) repeat protein